MDERPTPSQENKPSAPRDSAGTGVAAAWWRGVHGGWWLLLIAALLALTWWLWR
ncbi:MAG TPA: hypothetical protein VD865_06710 [Stenotrophomonas sp.]|nr:hypothetical protein [Stenotrophomonas sp.]